MRVFPKGSSIYALYGLFYWLYLLYNLFHIEPVISRTFDLVLAFSLFFLFRESLWHNNWRMLASLMIAFLIFTYLGIAYDKNVIVFALMFNQQLGYARNLPLLIAGLLSIFLLVYVTYTFATGNPLSLFTSFGFVILVILLAMPIWIYVSRHTKRLHKELDEANEKLKRYIQEEERNRIARDLHDTLGHTLTLIKVKSELADRMIDLNPQKAKDELKEIRDTSRIALQQVRDLVTNMKFVSLASVMEEAKQILAAKNIKLVIKECVPMPPLTKERETMLALSIREAVINVTKHSKASTCKITLDLQDGYYQVVIRDNGIGLDLKGDGYGIYSMQERLKLVKGDATIDSEGQGVQIQFRLPVLAERVEVS